MAVALLAVATLMIALAPGLAGAVSLTAGATAPDFTVRTLAGDEVSLHDYRGRVALVVFWSSWCSRCREEIAFLRTMREMYPALEILALNAETDRPSADDVARIREAAQTWGMPFAVAIDDGLRVWSRYEVNALPTSMIVGADGAVLFIEPNFFWASPEKINGALESAFASRAVGQAGAPAEGGQPAVGELGRSDHTLSLEEIEAETCRKELCIVAELPRP